jgi:hypothetical protein
MINDNFKITGALSIALNGEVVKEVPNTVVLSGKEFVASRMLGTTASVMSGMAIGTGSTAVDPATDTTLGTEDDRQALTSSAIDATDDNKVVYTATFGAGDGSGAITEAGIFNNASSGGTMLCRTVFPVVNKGANDSMTITWTITVS